MANLVPLHIDKDTGEIVATGVTTQSGGGTNAPSGYLHDQLIPALTWNITHNANSVQIIAQIFTTTGEMILPDELLIVDGNNIQVSFGSVQDGKAHILFFEVA